MWIDVVIPHVVVGVTEVVSVLGQKPGLCPRGRDREGICKQGTTHRRNRGQSVQRATGDWAYPEEDCRPMV